MAGAKRAIKKANPNGLALSLPDKTWQTLKNQSPKDDYDAGDSLATTRF
jgi:hypothetical protein